MKDLLPVRERRYRNPGRKPLEWRKVLNGIFYVLRAGCQWKAVPREFGSGSSLHRYFQQLVKFALEEYDELKGIQWKWQSEDGYSHAFVHFAFAWIIFRAAGIWDRVSIGVLFRTKRN